MTHRVQHDGRDVLPVEYPQEALRVGPVDDGHVPAGSRVALGVEDLGEGEIVPENGLAGLPAVAHRVPGRERQLVPVPRAHQVPLGGVVTDVRLLKDLHD